MEIWIKGAWLILAAVHVAPATVLFSPGMAEHLYGVAPDREIGALIIHRGALFLAVVVLATAAAFDNPARRSAVLVLAISILGYLFVYWRAGMPAGSLRTVAFADLLALAPLVFVAQDAWGGRQ